MVGMACQRCCLGCREAAAAAGAPTAAAGRGCQAECAHQGMCHAAVRGVVPLNQRALLVGRRLEQVPDQACRSDVRGGHCSQGCLDGAATGERWWLLLPPAAPPAHLAAPSPRPAYWRPVLVSRYRLKGETRGQQPGFARVQGFFPEAGSPSEAVLVHLLAQSIRCLAKATASPLILQTLQAGGRAGCCEPSGCHHLRLPALALHQPTTQLQWWRPLTPAKW